MKKGKQHQNKDNVLSYINIKPNFVGVYVYVYMNYEQKHKSIKENVKNGKFLRKNCIRGMTEWQVYIYTLFYFISLPFPSFYCSLKYVAFFFYCYYIKLRAHHKFL